MLNTVQRVHSFIFRSANPCHMRNRKYEMNSLFTWLHIIVHFWQLSHFITHNYSTAMLLAYSIQIIPLANEILFFPYCSYFLFTPPPPQNISTNPSASGFYFNIWGKHFGGEASVSLHTDSLESVRIILFYRNIQKNIFCSINADNSIHSHTTDINNLKIIIVKFTSLI